MTEHMLKQIEKEIANLREKVDNLTDIMQHLEEDFHDEKFDVRHEYIEKLRHLEKGRFLTQSEFEKALSD